MSTASNVLSQTLQSITNIKLRELQKQRSSFDKRKSAILERAQGDERERIKNLVIGLATLQGQDKYKTSLAFDDIDDWDLRLVQRDDLKTTNIRHYLRQSSYDPSIPSTLLGELDTSLRQLLDQRTEKFIYADLYSRLLTEWLKSDATNESTAAQSSMDTASDAGSEKGSSESFEVVERQKERLKQLSEKFESVVFSPLEIDTEAVTNLMKSLFEGDEGEEALSKLRKTIHDIGEDFASQMQPFDLKTLKWCITGLLKSDLLSDQKKNTLEGFLKDDVVLTEIGDVLNMRFVDLENWCWDEDEGIPVEPRRQLNGKYRVVMDEDILQSIFLHFIGITWAVKFKRELKELVEADRSVWRRTAHIPLDEQEKRQYYLGKAMVRPDLGLATNRQDVYMNQFFMCQLPSTEVQDTGYDHDEAPAPVQQASTGPRQRLLRALGAEVLVNRALNGQVALVQSDLQWFATSTSHETVDTILKFFNVPTIWRDFFQRYLQAPLRMVGLDGESGQVRTRKRGVPIGHVFQKLFGELIIFAMDLAVNQKANMLLYRLHDDLWLCGDPEKCATAWEVMKSCAKTLGVEFNAAKTGSVYITEGDVKKNDHIAEILPKGRVISGFLQLDAESGDWTIDQKQVDAHAEQLQKQLGECSSIFAWVQTWNSCIGRFFQHTFGEPANCFGQKHVDMILETHQRIQKKLFGGEASHAGSVTAYLKGIISDRFGVQNLPDAFLYYPEELGGLGLKNPFIPFLMVRDQVVKSPRGEMDNFFEAEKRAFKEAKEMFDEANERYKKIHLESIIGRKDSYHESPRTRSITSGSVKSKARPGWKGPDHDDFLSWEEYTRYRVATSSELAETYNSLQETPFIHELEMSTLVHRGFGRGPGSLNWQQLGPDRRWLLELYSKEVLDRFGGLQLVDKTLLPMGVMNLLRTRKVVWQAVL